MPELQPIRTGASGRSRPSRAQSLRSQSSWPTANLHRFLSGQHLDDVSVYHHEHDHQSDDNDEENTYSTDSLEEATEKEDDTDAREAGVEEVPEVREGIPDTKDLEAGRPPLEKKKTNRSIKDPNLVSIPLWHVQPVYQHN